MKSIQINGKNYVKARDLAEDLGYTTDYVGQLCRGGKVDAELVGRTWYVDPDSLHSHKATRYRSSKTKSHEAVKVAIRRLHESAPAPTRTPTTVHLRTHSYENDEAELIPTPHKHREPAEAEAPRRHLTVHVVERTESDKRAGANKLKVKSAPPLRIHTEKADQVSFAGAVAVQVLDELDTDEEQLRDIETVLAEVKPAPKQMPAGGVRVVSGDGAVRTRALKATSRSTSSPTHQYSFGYVVWSVSVVTTVACLLLVGLLSLETVTVVSENGVQYSYGFDIKETSTVLLSGLK